MQSHDYVPGVSGWKISKGSIEINSARLSVGGLSCSPQSITVTAGEWSLSELPANGVEYHAFIGAELAKIPPEHRDSAELSTEDISFDRDGSDIRTTLTYSRRETAEEVEARRKRAMVAGSRISLKDGVLTITHDGADLIRLGDLGEPFIVDSGQVFISQAFVDAGGG
ncbi:hypothetical protein [Pseudomonas donghuensis]|uniref:hypothetical protein n=1 Tax=Pseudomonas donghuensis TaxID=1163398 RepID=UPI002160704F|nr:hypothetical protein [Pseudomonas donghuensis]UVL26803.1 hypothetical protein LOY30_12750 [Pseudomonas donghuensis]